MQVLPPSDKCQWMKISNVFNSADAVVVVYDTSGKSPTDSLLTYALLCGAVVVQCTQHPEVPLFAL